MFQPRTENAAWDSSDSDCFHWPLYSLSHHQLPKGRQKDHQTGIQVLLLVCFFNYVLTVTKFWDLTLHGTSIMNSKVCTLNYTAYIWLMAWLNSVIMKQ